MIIELPKEFKYEGSGEERCYAEVVDGVLHIYGNVPFRTVMYNVTYALKGNDVCYYCKRKVKPSKITLDHVYAQDMGGPTITDNLVPCCEDCNCRKSNLSESEYKMFIQLSKTEKEFFKKFIEFKHEKIRESAKFEVPDEWVDYEYSGEFFVRVELDKKFKGKKYSYNKKYYKQYHTIQKPIVTDKNGLVLDGYIGLMVAKEMELKHIPTITLENVIMHL